MSDRDRTKLTPQCRVALAFVETLCKSAGFPMVFYDCLRPCDVQARLFRSTRTRAEINAKMQSLTDMGYPFLAEIIEAVGPQEGTLGQHRTKAGPGESWHNYGEAFDAAPLKGPRVIWDASHPGFAAYGHACQIAGLTWGGTWGWDFPHAQLRSTKNPLRGGDPTQIRQLLLDAGSIDA